MARPRLYTNAAIIAALKRSQVLAYIAARGLGRGPDTIYHRLKRSPEVAACLRAQRGVIVDTAEEKLFAAIRAREPWAIAMTLRTLGRSRGYEDRTVHELDGVVSVLVEEVVDGYGQPAAPDQHANGQAAPGAAGLPA